ncbi:MAG: hypothetical protein AAF611_07325 [Bacteroidota bacterium]
MMRESGNDKGHCIGRYYILTKYHLQLKLTVIKCTFFLSSLFKKENVATATLDTKINSAQAFET